MEGGQLSWSFYLITSARSPVLNWDGMGKLAARLALKDEGRSSLTRRRASSEEQKVLGGLEPLEPDGDGDTVIN